MATINYDEKAAVRDAEPQIFEEENHPEKPIPKYDKIDYSGAHEKTDPKEIALVKKLDRWMMVSPPHLPVLLPLTIRTSLCYGACTG